MANTETWPTLAKLAGMSEPERRQLLRSHLEFEFVDRRDIQTRVDLDEELGQIAGQELRAQAMDSRVTPLASDHFRTLVDWSPAFGQYLNQYLYFSLRFAAGRLGNVSRPVPLECNEPKLALPAPPLMIRRGLPETVDRFLELKSGSKALDALLFLDDYVQDPFEHGRFELWLRGLYAPADSSRFEQLADGLLEWVAQRCEFYQSLEERPLASAPAWQHGAWKASNPLTARCGIYDLYWLAKILRAEVSSRGLVTYQDHSWLAYLAAQNPPRSALNKDQILHLEAVLREVFGFACDLVYNAVEIAEDQERRTLQPGWYARNRPGVTKDWRETYDEELAEIHNQRLQRAYQDHASPAIVRGQALPEPIASARREGWSMRACTGETVDDLAGLAFSGGGIRSATFNLGVLQRLRDLDLLRKVDILSTVSGGGYIGAWLLGNVRRTHYWLSRLTNWEDSIGHLRRYSNYLAPHNGLMSVDTWSMWGTWLRNALLIQLSTVVWLMALLVAVQGFQWTFLQLACGGEYSRALLGAVIAGVAFTLCFNLRNPDDASGSRTPVVGAFLAWAGSFLSAALFWNYLIEWDDSIALSYSAILRELWKPLIIRALFALLVVSMFAITWCSFSLPKAIRAVAAAAVSIAGVAIMYLTFGGVMRILAEFREDANPWYAYVFGPALTMFAVAIAVIIFIGLMGRTAPDWNREWWTRFGAWLGILGTVCMTLSLLTIFGPFWMKQLVHRSEQSINWWTVSGTLAGWLGTVAGGILAGNSDRTRGTQDPNGKPSLLQPLAAIGAFVFITGAVLSVSAGLHKILVLIWMDKPAGYWNNLDGITRPGVTLATLAALLTVGTVLSWRFEINIFGLNQFYRNRLVRCYLGATRWLPGMRRPHPFTGFDQNDDLKLAELRSDSTRYCNEPFRGPFPVVNCTINLGGSSDLAVHTRRSASFTLTPLRCGFSRQKGGYAPTAPTGSGAYAGGITLGQAIAVSGAAASPNMGYNTSPLVAFLLTMFNVRLGWWFPNPAASWWNWQFIHFSLWYLVKELFGNANEGGRFVNISDGGHFENLGIYELVRRRAKIIIASDAECDSGLAFGSLGNVIRLCETDFGARIDLDVSSIRKAGDSNLSRAHCAVGKITYGNGSLGYLIYLKASMTGDESADIVQYHAAHPDFPHQSTADQFYTEDQFESYRRLGYHITDRTFRGIEGELQLLSIAAKLLDFWAPAGFNNDAFTTHATALNAFWDHFREAPRELGSLLRELTSGVPGPRRATPLTEPELSLCLQALQLMECVFMDLRLDDFWEHPDHRGWAMLFTMWAKCPSLQAAWSASRRTFGIRFEYFCHERLGLPMDQPVVRV